jgi:hypothetical protein
VPASRAGPHATTLQPMSTRIIVTSQPDVACFICERRLLRGEQPESFLVDGAPQTVCELCAPRAAHMGWPRGDEGQVVAEPVLAARRGGGLFARLRGAARPTARRPAAPASARGAEELQPGALAAGEALSAGEAAVASERDEGAEEGPTQPGPLEWALQAFNLSEFPRRIASLSRSLGEPEVCALHDQDLHIVTIVVAWELCWYRYRVELDEDPDVRMIAEGRTLEELDRAERSQNATADARGELSLIAAAV